MTALFHFESKVHRRNLTRAESTSLLFPRLLCQVLEHIGFPTEPSLERYRDHEAILTVDRWQIMPYFYHLPPPDPAEDHPAADLHAEERPPITVHTEEHQVPVSSVPTPLPTAPASSAPPETSAPSTTTPIDVASLSTSAPPQQHITISTRDFLAIMDVVCAFFVTSASFAATHTSLAKRMTSIEAALT